MIRHTHEVYHCTAPHLAALRCKVSLPPELARGLSVHVHWLLSRAEMEGIHPWPGGRCGVVRGTGWGRRVGAGQAAGVPPVPGVSLLVCREHRMVTSATTPMAVARAAKEIPPITRDLVELNWRRRDV